MYKNSYPHKRYNKTLEFLLDNIKPPANILDLGVKNPFSTIMQQQGFIVTNTQGEDLDNTTTAVENNTYDVVTAFEIFEHLLAPYNVLKAIRANRLIASVPLKLWFAAAYRNKNDIRDQHFHEFEPWQFDWLLDKTGWEIKARAQWTHPVKKIGIRPVLRMFTPRYYAIYAERKKAS